MGQELEAHRMGLSATRGAHEGATLGSPRRGRSYAACMRAGAVNDRSTCGARRVPACPCLPLVPSLAFPTQPCPSSQCPDPALRNKEQTLQACTWSRGEVCSRQR